MPNDQTIKINGKVIHVFAHRFVVQTSQGPVLADLTPHGLEKIKLRVDDQVALEGEQKPSELKVAKLTLNSGKTFEISHKEKKGHHFEAEPGIALKSAEQAGFETLGAPRRKPKHFEVLGRRDGHLSELHIELDGHIRKVKSDFDQGKWADAIRAA